MTTAFLINKKKQPTATERQAAPLAISSALAETDILYYSTSFGANIFSRALESLPFIFKINKPNIRILLNEL
jgi:hypothetical protein